jgi:predicted secreted protein
VKYLATRLNGKSVGVGCRIDMLGKISSISTAPQQMKQTIATRGTVSLMLAALLTLGIVPTTAIAQNNSNPVVPDNIVRLNHSESAEVAQDTLRIALHANKEGADLASVQGELKRIVDRALRTAKTEAKPKLLEVRTGYFSAYPRYGSNNKTNGWSGSAELVIEGTDMGAISKLAGRLEGMAVSQTSFGLSVEQKKFTEDQITEKAIRAFQAKATQISKWFGANSYQIADVQVGSEGGVMPIHREMAMMSKASGADTPVPVEPGKSQVTVLVSGAIKLR